MATARPTKLVILDRDDTLIRVPSGCRYLFGEDEIQFMEGAVPFLRQLADAGVAAVIATNQQGVALPEYPDMTIESVDRFHRRLLHELDRHGAPVARVYVCPHAAAANCTCRKPRPSLFLAAMRDFGASPGETAAIGDQWRDALAASAAGIQTLFLMEQGQSTTDQPGELAEVRTVSSLDDCLGQILGWEES